MTTNENQNTTTACPNCGYCPHCGWSYRMVPYWLYPRYINQPTGIVSTSIGGPSGTPGGYEANMSGSGEIK